MQTLRKTKPLTRGNGVLKFQQLVTAAGFDCGALDSLYGDKCVAACKAFQQARGLVVDGICGAKTWAALQAVESGGTSEPKSAHFKMSEFKCKDGTAVPKEYWKNLQSLMDNKLEPLRHACGDVPINIVSGYRTETYNKKVGGAKKSQHLYANAADIRVQGKTPAEVYTIADKLFAGSGGVGKYPTFTHIDDRETKARW